MGEQATNFLSDDAMERMKKSRGQGHRRGHVNLRDERRDAVMRMVFSTPGLPMEIVQKLGVTHQSVSQWNKVPPHHVMALVPLLNLTPEQIRPDIFKRPRK